MSEPDFVDNRPTDVEKPDLVDGLSDAENFGISESDSDDRKYIRRWFFPDPTPVDKNEIVLDTSESDTSESDDDDSLDQDEGLQEGDPFDSSNELFSPSRDYLIRRRGEGSEQVEKLTVTQCLENKTHVVILMFHIPVMKEDEVSLMCCQLNGIFTELAEETQDIQVVLVTRMRSDFPGYDNKQVAEDAFSHFFSGFSPVFLAVPISDSEASLTLFEKGASIDYIRPAWIVADLKNQVVVNTNIREIIRNGLDFPAFPGPKLPGDSYTLYDILCGGQITLSTLLNCKSNEEFECVSCGSGCGKKESLRSLTDKVVFLYYLCSGSLMDQVCELYQQCKDKKFEFALVVVRPKSYLVMRLPDFSSWEKLAESLLHNSDCCGMLHLPVTDRVSRRIHNLCGSMLYEKLLVVGPNTCFVELNGEEVYRKYGIDAYPFTKEAVCEFEVARLRSLRLQNCLKDCGIKSLKLGAKNFPVSDLDGKYVLVLFGNISSTGKLDCYGEADQLLKWVQEMEAAAEGRFSVIFACINKDVKVEGFSLDDFCSEKRWFLPVASNDDCSSALVHLLYRDAAHCYDDLVAFGPNGQLLRLGLERSLEESLEPATFPETDSDLPEDVALWLNAFWETEPSWSG